MRFLNTKVFLFYLPFILLSGCQGISNQMTSFGGANSAANGATNSISQVVTTTKTVMSAPVESVKTTVVSMAPKSLVATADSVSGSVASAADAVGINAGDVFTNADSEVKTPLTLKGAFNGALVAIGLKASQAEKTAKQQAKAAKAFAASLVPRSVDLVIEATSDANGDSEGHGLSTIFRFYALPDTAAFSQLTAVDATDKTLSYQEQIVFPNRISRFRQKFPSDSQFVGVLFQLHNRPHRWKLLIPVNRLQADQPLHVVLGRCDINVKSGLMPASNNPSPATQSVSTSVKATPKIPVSTIESALSAVC